MCAEKILSEILGGFLLFWIAIFTWTGAAFTAVAEVLDALRDWVVME